MMSDLLEIAEAAGIAIVDFQDDEAGDDGKTVKESFVNEPLTGDEGLAKLIEKWNLKFGDRYTLADPDYAKVVESADATNTPPCVVDFNCWRRRDDHRNWSRDRGGRGNRGNYRSDRNRHSGDRGDAWNREDNRRQHHQQYYGAHQERRRSRSPNRDGAQEHQSWRNDNYHNRGYGYHQHRTSYGRYQNKQDESYRNADQ